MLEKETINKQDANIFEVYSIPLEAQKIISYL